LENILEESGKLASHILETCLDYLISELNGDGARGAFLHASAAAVAPIRPGSQDDPIRGVHSIPGGYGIIPLFNGPGAEYARRAILQAFFTAGGIVHGVIAFLSVNNNLNTIVGDRTAGIIVQDNLDEF
jgi:hypothetical protein